MTDITDLRIQTAPATMKTEHHAIPLMSLSVKLPAELESEVEKIPDWEARVAWFAKEQVALEQWRTERSSIDDRAWAKSIMERAEVKKKEGFSREEVGERLLSRWKQMMSTLEE